MSVSDSITDLPPCSPLIFGGAGQWRGSHSGTVGFKLKRLSGSFKSHRKWCHSLKDTYWEFPFFFSSPLGLQARCILPCNYTPSFGGMKVAHHHLAGRSWWTQRACWDLLLSWFPLLSTWCENNIHPSIFCYLVLIPRPLSHHWEKSRNKPWTDLQPDNNIAYIVWTVHITVADVYNPFRAGYVTLHHINGHEFTQNSLLFILSIEARLKHKFSQVLVFVVTEEVWKPRRKEQQDFCFHSVSLIITVHLNSRVSERGSW